MADIWSEKNVGFIGPIKFLLDLTVGPTCFAKSAISVYANYFYDTSVIFSNSFITYREPFRICIGHDRQTDVIGIDCNLSNITEWNKKPPPFCFISQLD